MAPQSECTFPSPGFAHAAKPVPSPADKRHDRLPTAPASASSPLGQRSLAGFRGTARRRTTIHPLELAALWVIAAHLCFLPWALGGMRVWAQVVSLVLAAFSLFLALLPRNYTEKHTGSNSFRQLMWPKLIKFPIFWIGLALLGYITLQALNPAWIYETNGKAWWMRRVDAKSWLPTGVVAPFEKWNQWRMLIIYASAWATVCAVWVAFTGRRTLQLFVITLAVNGLLVALLGVAQRLTKAGKIYWFFESPNGSFFSSFIYKNHGGTYLDLILAITCGLASWFCLRGLRRLEKSNPSGVLAFFAACIAVAILISYARGATLVMLALVLGCIGAFLVHHFLLPKESRKPVILVALVLVFGCFLKTGSEALSSGEAWDRLRKGVLREDDSLSGRQMATAAALEMLHDEWKSGIGAGSFRFLFPIYQQRYPQLAGDSAGPLFWEHAHNDIVQFPIELGIVGCGLLAMSGLYWLFALTKSRSWNNPLSTCMIFGAVLVLIYGWWDFPFQCPAVLITWCMLWPLAAMWARFEQTLVRPAADSTASSPA
jgi:hypothetical protein